MTEQAESFCRKRTPVRRISGRALYASGAGTRI